jgi:hypothetical protein
MRLISLIRNSQDLTIWSYNGITPEKFRNINFVNKDGQKISFGRIHQNVGLVEKNTPSGNNIHWMTSLT